MHQFSFDQVPGFVIVRFLFVFLFLHRFVFWLVLCLPRRAGWALSLLLSTVYLVDFACSARAARRTAREKLLEEAAEEPAEELV